MALRQLGIGHQFAEIIKTTKPVAARMMVVTPLFTGMLTLVTFRTDRPCY